MANIYYTIEKINAGTDDEVFCFALTGETFGAREIIKQHGFRWDGNVAPGMEKAWRTNWVSRTNALANKELYAQLQQTLTSVKTALKDAGFAVVKI